MCVGVCVSSCPPREGGWVSPLCCYLPYPLRQGPSLNLNLEFRLGWVDSKFLGCAYVCPPTRCKRPQPAFMWVLGSTLRCPFLDGRPFPQLNHRPSPPSSPCTNSYIFSYPLLPPPSHKQRGQTTAPTPAHSEISSFLLAN